ncbi:MAG TPA: NAD(P)H-quinone oxidoreductase [Xanthobacteraceae bacterium]|nr:NAD(P)H-quinone oxidoreductase [Xanthobacteraceae bacterium]
MTDLPATMTAIAIPTPGGPQALVPQSRPVPRPRPGEVLVKVAAAGVNRPDVMQRKGLYPPPPGAPDIPGLEIAGTVAAVGEGVTRWTPGDAVCALVSGGGYAEYCLAEQGSTLPVPAGLSLLQAAALPETFFTVWTNVFDLAGLKAGETFLVHGGTSGIGTTAIQLARAFGARVFATAGSLEKCTVCRELGAELAVDYKTGDFVAEVKQATGGRGANVILDMVGGSYIARNYEVAAPLGRIVQIAFMEGSKVQIDYMRLMLKRLSHMGSTLRSRPGAEKAAIAAALEAKVWPLLAAGTVRPVLDRSFPLREAAAAHARMESSAHIGKIVLDLA